MPADIILYNDADPQGGGHHFEHIQYLLEYWIKRRLEGTLKVVIAADFLRLHPGLAERIADGRSAGISLVCLDRQVTAAEQARGGRLFRARRAAALLSVYVERMRPACCLLLSFDQFQLAFALGLRFAFPVKFAGIYFRPAFHYGIFAAPLKLRDRMLRLRQMALLALATRNPHLATLFCLDPYSAAHLRRLNPRIRALPLADPVVAGTPRASGAGLKRVLNIEAHRRVFLLFGDLSRRKGTLELLAAAELLGEQSCRQACLVLAGRIAAGDSETVLRQVAWLRATRPLQIVVHDRFIDEAEVRQCYAMADVVLVPYQRHVGNSGVLMRAAAAGVPVLGPDYGLLGHLIRRHRLGLAIDTTSPRALAMGIERFLGQDPASLIDAARADALARRNDARAFGATIFTSLIAEHDGHSQ